jgi:hypothetical protein
MPYFLVKNQKIIDQYNKYQEDHRNMRLKANKLVKELKGGDYLLSPRSGLVGIEFKKGKPSKDWVPYYTKKKSSRVYRPHQGTTQGKEYQKRFKEVGRVSRSELDKLSGFGRGLFIGNMYHTGPGLETGVNGELIMKIQEDVCLCGEFNMPEGLEELTLTNYTKIRKDKKS